MRKAGCTSFRGHGLHPMSSQLRGRRSKARGRVGGEGGVGGVREKNKEEREEERRQEDSRPCASSHIPTTRLE
eukprot:752194-Hanusia_phi.AAC.2